MARAIEVTGAGGFIEVGAGGASIDVTFHTSTGGGGGAVASVNGQTGTVVLGASDVGAAPALHAHAATDVTAGVFDPARLGTGTPDAAKVLKGDGTWGAVTGGDGLWEPIATFDIAAEIARLNTDRLNQWQMVLPVGRTWRALRVTLAGFRNGFTASPPGPREFRLSVNGDGTAVWRGSGLVFNKDDTGSQGSTWSPNIAGAGSVHTGTTPSLTSQFGATFRDGATSGEIMVFPQSASVHYLADLMMFYREYGDAPTSGRLFRVLNNGRADIAGPLTSLDFTADLSVAGRMFVEGIPT